MILPLWSSARLVALFVVGGVVANELGVLPWVLQIDTQTIFAVSVIE